MGKHNSSLTRVQPVFTGLYQQDRTGRSWLRPLLALGSRSAQIGILEIGNLVGPPVFEFEADPDPGYLLWLVSNADRLSPPAESYWRLWSRETQQLRRKLLLGHSNTRFSAMAKVAFFYPPARRAWWRLEGVTKVDCALIADNALVFIEGKRTELGASKDVLWYRGRNQVLRNLDCAREMARRAGIPNYYVLLIVEQRLSGQGTARWSELQQVVDPATVESSFPHLKAEEREAVMQRFLGYTTWEQVADRFRLDSAILPGLHVKANSAASGRG